LEGGEKEGRPAWRVALETRGYKMLSDKLEWGEAGVLGREPSGSWGQPSCR